MPRGREPGVSGYTARGEARGFWGPVGDAHALSRVRPEALMFARLVFYCMGQMQVAGNSGQSCRHKWSRRRQGLWLLGALTYCYDKLRLRIKKQRYQIRVLQLDPRGYPQT